MADKMLGHSSLQKLLQENSRYDEEQSPGSPKFAHQSLRASTSVYNTKAVQIYQRKTRRPSTTLSMSAFKKTIKTPSKIVSRISFLL